MRDEGWRPSLNDLVAALASSVRRRDFVSKPDWDFRRKLLSMQAGGNGRAARVMNRGTARARPAGEPATFSPEVRRAFSSLAYARLHQPERQQEAGTEYLWRT